MPLAYLGDNEFHLCDIYDLTHVFFCVDGCLWLFTIGSREGLAGGSAQPLYVVDLGPATNRVIVGSAEDLVSDEFEIDRVNWVSRGEIREACEVTVKIRYSHPGSSATLTPREGNRACLRLHQPQKAVTPGQAAVFYEDDMVLGGGWFCRQSALALA